MIDDTAQDMAALGIQYEEPLREAEQRTFEVFEENWEAVQVFLVIQTQWRAGAGGLTGLDYSVLFKVMDLYDIQDKRAVLNDIQIMEDAILRKIYQKTATHGRH